MSLLFCKLLTSYALLNTSYKSFKALHRSQRLQHVMNTREYDKDKKERYAMRLSRKELLPLLKFWTVFALLATWDYAIEGFVMWMPFYSTFKLLGLLWLTLPYTNGAVLCFENFLVPRLDERLTYIENTLLPAIRTRVIGGVRNILKKSGTLSKSVLGGVPGEELDAASEQFRRLRREMQRELLKRGQPVTELEEISAQVVEKCKQGLEASFGSMNRLGDRKDITAEMLLNAAGVGVGMGAFQSHSQDQSQSQSQSQSQLQVHAEDNPELVNQITLLNDVLQEYESDDDGWGELYPERDPETGDVVAVRVWLEGDDAEGEEEEEEEEEDDDDEEEDIEEEDNPDVAEETAKGVDAQTKFGDASSPGESTSEKHKESIGDGDGDGDGNGDSYSKGRRRNRRRSSQKESQQGSVS